MSKISFSLLLRVSMLSACGFVFADGVPPEYINKPAPIYRPHEGDCYVLLKPQPPYIESGNTPVCKAVLSNMNKFCSEPPQHNHRKLHPTTRDIQEPKWEAMDASENLDLVKEIYLSQIYKEYREGKWSDEKDRVLSLAKFKKLFLSRADIDLDGRAALETVYLLGNLQPDDPPKFNQSKFMPAYLDKKVFAEDFNRIGSSSVGDLWLFKSQWYVIRYLISEKRFSIDEIVRPTEESAGAVTVCSIQHVSDRQGDR